MRPIILFLLCAAAGAAQQVQLSLTPMPQAAVRRMLGRRVAKVAGIYLVSAENLSTSTVSISEAAVLRRVPQITPLDSGVTMAQLVADAQARSALERIAGFGGDASTGVSFLGTGNVIKLNTAWTVGLAAAGFALPYTVKRIQGAEKPVQANFGKLAWTVPLVLAPGGAGTAHVFAAADAKAAPVTITLDPAAMAQARIAQ